MAYVRLKQDSPLFRADAGDTVELSDDVAELLVESGAAVPVPAQACRGLKARPGSLALEDQP